MTTMETLKGASPAVREALERALAGDELGEADALVLDAVTGADLDALVGVADALRRAQVGDAVTYVVNRNVNFTNACTKACRFCAFSRGFRTEETYFLDEDEILRRVVEARDLGATEVCLQAGLARGLDGWVYRDLCRAVKRVTPEIHVHAFSPEEVKYGARLANVSIRRYLEELRDAGLGSLPGTSAEILDDELRDRLSPGRITTGEWVDLIRTAHELGIPTTSTMMYGHLETSLHRVRHLLLLRSIQKDTGGFTEFVPLSFVADEAPAVKRGLVPGIADGATQDEVVRVHALARVLLGASFRHIQASWVKEGIPMAKRLLDAGADDLGGTLMNESISTSAGAQHGQLMTPRALRRAIADVGRTAVQRDTRYRVVRAFAAHEHDVDLDPLDGVSDAESRFGSFRTMTRDPRFRLNVVNAPRPGAGVTTTSAGSGGQ